MPNDYETSAQAYCGERGRAYWARNQYRLHAEGHQRRLALHSLLPNMDLETWCEVGCGRGHNLFPGDVGVDVDERQVRYLLPDKIPIVADATEHLPFIEDTFPVVFSVGLLMHLPAPQWYHALDQMACISSRYVIIGEHWSVEEQPVDNPYWSGLLWSRTYHHPLLRLYMLPTALPPFDANVRFAIFAKVPKL